MKDFVCAGIANTTQMLIGYPLDTAKVWAQSNTPVKMSIKHLYSGIKYPLIGQGAMTGLCFSIYDYGIKQSYHPVVSAFASGSLISVLIVPFEIAKIVKQHDPNTKIVRSFSLYKMCVGPVFLRETSYITMFLNLNRYFNEETDLSPTIYGGICSSISWIATYPLDTYKTNSILLHSTGKKMIRKPLFDIGLVYSLCRVSLGGSIFMTVFSWLKQI